MTTPAQPPIGADAERARAAWGKVLTGMQRFGMESEAIDTVEDFFASMVAKGETKGDQAIIAARFARQLAEQSIPLKEQAARAALSICADWIECLALSASPEQTKGEGDERVVVESVETVPINHPFNDEMTPPIWRVRIGEQCADFEYEAAARNFASAIATLAQPEAMIGEGK